MATPGNLPGRIDTGLATDWVAVTPSDTVNLVPGPCFGIYVGGAGNVAAVAASGNVETFTAVAAGSTLQIRAVRINATNTTATLMKALYTSQ